MSNIPVKMQILAPLLDYNQCPQNISANTHQHVTINLLKYYLCVSLSIIVPFQYSALVQFSVSFHCSALASLPEMGGISAGAEGVPRRLDSRGEGWYTMHLLTSETTVNGWKTKEGRCRLTACLGS